jgi:hypothetical protein
MTDKNPPSAIDTLLLAIIAAYEPARAADTHDKRLALAKEALFGVRRTKGRPKVDDAQALLQIAQEDLQRIFQLVGPPLAAAIARRHGKPVPRIRLPQLGKPSSARARSRRATRLTYAHSTSSAEDRLRKKYRKATLGQLAEIESEVESRAMEMEMVTQILQLLARLGVKTSAHLGRK